MNLDIKGEQQIPDVLFRPGYRRTLELDEWIVNYRQANPVKVRRAPKEDCGLNKVDSTAHYRVLNFWDLKQVYEVARVAFPKSWTEKDYAYFLSHEHCYAVGIFDKEQLCSYWLGLLIDGHWDIVSVATHPRYQRREYSERLFKFSVGEKKIKKVFLEVAVDNVPAVRLYEKLGFKKFRVRKKYYQNFKDAVEMMWEC